jgi:hypothetical protein
MTSRRRGKKSEETQFLRGEIGVDGEAIEAEEKDEEELERARAKEELIRGRTYLGREFLTWLLFKTNAADDLDEVDGEALTGLFTGRLILRGLAGEATEIAVKGTQSPYSELVRIAIDRGLLVHSGRIRLQHGERVYEVTLDAEHLDLKAGRIPALLAEEEDDRIGERLYLAEQLTTLIETLLQRFLEVRASKRWATEAVPALKAWLEGR